jgi:histidyl-tRNA synthetase
VWYSGPNFRYEKAQAGRYRQFDQVGVEVLGSEDPYLDVEVVALGWTFFQSLGLQNVTLLINSLGDSGDRDAYTEVLRAYLESRIAELSEEARQTLMRNPLRVLDSKRPQDAAVIADAPILRDHIGDSAREAFDRVLQGLTDLNIPFVVSDRLVRGLDYYRRTTFEFQSTALDGSQNAVGGGGRYDGLVEDLGGPATPGIGFALGVDRTLLACDAEGVFPAPSQAVDIFIVDAVDGRVALRLTHELRALGLRVDRGFDGRSMKSQMKAADRSGASIAIIIGSDEADAGTCTVRNLRTSEQTVVTQSQLGSHLSHLLTTP